MRYSSLFFIFSGLYFGFLGAFEIASKNPAHQRGHYANSYSQGELLSIRIKEKISENPQRIRFEAEVITVENEVTNGRIYVTVPCLSDGRPIVYGDTLITKEDLKEISAAINPGGFDFKSFSAKRNVHHQLYLHEGDFLRRSGARNDIYGISIRINQRLQKALERVLREPEALGVAKALLLGYRLEISQDLLQDYKGAGAMHILAISGLHVGIILMIIMRLTRRIRSVAGGRQLQLILGVLILWCFALVTGMTVSVVRSVSMFSLLVLGRVLDRNSRLLDNVLTSALFLLLFNPLYLFNVGFQLSYSALFGIALVTPLMSKLKNSRWPILNYFVGLVLISCAAQAGVMPLSLMYFNQFSGLFLVSSLVLIPVIGATLGTGYALTLIALVAEPPRVAADLYETWIGLLNGAVELIGGVELMILREVYFPLHFCALTYLALLFFFWGAFKNKIRLVYLFGILIICMQLMWAIGRREAVKKEELVVFHLWKESLILKRSGTGLFTAQPLTGSPKKQRAIRDYSRRFPGSFSVAKQSVESMQPGRIFSVDSETICVIDTSVRWVEPELKPKVLVLVRSPRLNLDRVLQEIEPTAVVADGSNYPSFADRWKKSCQLRGVPFHSTTDMGAYRYPAPD